jgi:hypothetical protein
MTSMSLFNLIPLYDATEKLRILSNKITSADVQLVKKIEKLYNTLEEIRKICDYNDKRIKPIVYTMCSGGLRLGAWDCLKWKNIIPIKRNGQIVAALVEVYAGTESQYPTLITKECYHSLDSWINFRKESGEKILRECRNEIEVGPGGRQIQVEDPDGNPIEWLELQFENPLCYGVGRL